MQPLEHVPTATDWQNIIWTEADYQDLASLVEMCDSKDVFLLLKACYPIEAMRKSWHYLSEHRQNQIRTWLGAIAKESAA